MAFWRGRRRRKSIRVRVRTTVRVQVDGRPRFYEARTRDLSVGGAKVALSRRLPAGAEVQCQFEFPHCPAPVGCRARVVWSDPVSGLGGRDGAEAWLAGLEFVQVARSARKEIKRFIARARERHPRRKRTYWDGASRRLVVTRASALALALLPLLT